MNYPCNCRGPMGMGMGRLYEHPITADGVQVGVLLRYVCDACGATKSEPKMFAGRSGDEPVTE